MPVDTHGLTEWIYGTGLSSAIRDNSWVVPVVQSIHIIAITVVVGCALVTELRIVGVVAPDESMQVVVQRYLPWMWRALAVLLATGLVMIIGEPERTLSNVTFWIKMALVLTGVLASLRLRKPLLRPAEPTDKAPAKVLAWTLLVLWVAVIFCGRWIAYSN
jgi:putative copper export protein